MASGKPKKVALIACIRKLVIILNSMVRDGVMWDPKLIAGTSYYHVAIS
ncbi:transposase (IS492) [Cycloclasticus pugetii]|uniref:Transposase (IS492) n=1 Tax=Cycloclasticus pugetii TaxID=34068 RepID=A0AB33Z2D0_9GAMM|nr:transposase (IS492) [Cycloclasticus pugetii]